MSLTGVNRRVVVAVGMLLHEATDQSRFNRVVPNMIEIQNYVIGYVGVAYQYG